MCHVRFQLTAKAKSEAVAEAIVSYRKSNNTTMPPKLSEHMRHKSDQIKLKFMQADACLHTSVQGKRDTVNQS